MTPIALLTARRTDLTPLSAFVAQHGDVFAVFDAQDSGNVSYGVRAGDERFFIKTAGSPHDARPYFSPDGRIALLRNAVLLARAVSDPAMPALRNVVESPEGPLLVYTWVDGELVGTTRERRSDPTSTFARFRALDHAERAAAVDAILRLHVQLAEREWIACDFYDGSLMYDFAQRRIHVIDLDLYRHGPFVNDMGRMFGSDRFMAPEEYELGARIDERTTVFTMGRTVINFLSPGSAAIEGLVARACDPEPERRFQTVAEFYGAWSEAAPITGQRAK